MKRLFILISACFSISSLNGQSLEFFSGISTNLFHDSQENTTHFFTEYNSGFGYAVGFGIDVKELIDIPLRFAISLENYQGEIFSKAAGLAGYSITKVKAVKNSINVGIYPMNYNIKQKLQINVGGEFGLFVSEKILGYKSYAWLGLGDNYTSLDYSSIKISNNFTFGIRGRVAYEINLAESLTIVPQYQFYLGLKDEFNNIPVKARSKRHYLLIGIYRILK